jgi:hypothetical protein
VYGVRCATRQQRDRDPGGDLRVEVGGGDRLRGATPELVNRPDEPTAGGRVVVSSRRQEYHGDVPVVGYAAKNNSSLVDEEPLPQQELSDPGGIVWL